MNANLMQKLTKIIKWPWKEKIKVRVTQKGCSWRDLIKVIKHAKWIRANLDAKVNQNYLVTLNRKSQGQGHTEIWNIAVEEI